MLILISWNQKDNECRFLSMNGKISTCHNMKTAHFSSHPILKVKINLHDLSISKAFQTQTRKSGQGQFFLVTPVN